MGNLLLVASGISAWLAVYNLVVFAVRRQLITLWMALWSVLSLVYQVARHFELQPVHVVSLDFLDRLCVVSSIGLMVLVLLTVKELSGARALPRLIHGLIAVLCVGVVLTVTTPLILNHEVDSYVDLSGTRIPFTAAGVLYAPFFLSTSLAAFGVSVLMVHRSTTLTSREKWAWLVGLLGYQFLGGNDVMLFSGITRALLPSLPGQTMFEFAVVGMAVALSLRNARRAELSQQELESKVLQRTRELERALAEARTAIEAKATFLASMSHEVRTPLNGILGLTELMLDEPLPPSAKERLSLVLRSGRTLKALVDDVLDFAKLDAHGLTLSQADFSPTASLRDIVALYEGNARAKGLTLSLELNSVPALAVGDEQRLRQIISNLVNNAVKFTERGGVRLCATVNA